MGAHRDFKMVFFAKTPDIVKPLASDMLWSIEDDTQSLYLTFDDGPTEGVTSEVLQILDDYNAKATFFCIGGNVKKNPDLYAKIIMKGHRTGNHTWNHMNGWEYSDYSYLRNIIECSELVKSSLFRPPYGRIKRSQVRALKDRFTIVMWDVLSGDWRSDLSKEQCASNVINHAKPGSIIVFHDSLKAQENILYALPKVLSHFHKKGFTFKSIPEIY